MKFNINDQRSNTKENKTSESIFKKEITLFGNQFSENKKERFYEELSVLLLSGVDLKRSLDLLIQSTKNEKDLKIYKGLVSSISEGSNFAEALSKTSTFSNHEIKSIEIGEQTGTTPKILKDLAQFYKNRNKQKREIISAISYPVIVLFTAIIVIFFMLNYVVPMFRDIFNQNNLELPFLTNIIVSLSNIVQNQFAEILIFFAGIFVFYFYAKEKFWFKKIKDRTILGLPFLGIYVKKIKLTRLMQILSLQAKAKIPLSSALNLVSELIDFYPLTNNLKDIEKDIIKGDSISSSFGKHSFFDAKIITFLKVAEETNNTEYVFQKLYEQYSVESDYYAKNMANYLNPLLTLLVGFIVAIILIAMYLPMFKLSTVVN